MRKAILLIVGAALLAPAVAQADAPGLAGTTVVRADQPGWSAVRLDKAIKLGEDAASPFKATLEGSGILRRMILRADLPDLEERRPTVTFYEFDGEAFVWFNTDSLPAGSYRLYAVSDKPIVATLKTKALAGSLDLIPDKTIELLTAKQGRGTGLVPSTSIGFASFTDKRSIEGAFSYSVEGALPAREERCVAVFQQADAASYDLGCPGGFYESILPGGDVRTTSGTSTIDFASSPGEIGYGGNFTAADDVKLTVTGVAFAYDDPPLALSAPAPLTPPAAPILPWATVPAATARVRRGQALITVACAAPEPCRGRLAVARRRVAFRVPAGDARIVRIRVPQRAKRISVALAGRNSAGALVGYTRLVRLVRR